ncbi:MAG: leucine-rich repeat domain-containing protein [Clostridia bacterium]|nr:leucine-rich repeat domain-containing protein [Clostridia bacterium]
MKNRDFKDSRLIDAFSYIDPKYIAEVADSLKLSNNSATPIIAKRRSWRHIAALAACVLLLGAVIPMITYVLRNFGDIAAWLPENTTEETAPLTEPDDPTKEPTAEETTSEPQTTACTHPRMVTSEVIPNCTEKYTIYSWCSDCDYTENTIMPPYGHRFIDGICQICGATDECKHSLFTATENVPTCTESATVNYQCSSCGHTWSEVLPALGHNFVNNICTRCGVEIEYDGSRGLEYEISSDGKYAILVGIGTCTDKDIVVATTYNGIPVARIDSYALYNCQFIESVTIPEGITIIHDEAFYLCKNLKKVTLPSTLKWIQDWAFAGCESLETVRIPNSVTQISIRAFSDCKNLSSLTLGAGVELIEESAFENCTSLTSVTFPKTLRLLANDAFAGCTSLTNIHYAGTIQEWNSVDSAGRDYGNNHIWYEGVPGERITCTNGYIFISPISEYEAYEAAREFLGIPKSQIGGKYEFATKTKDPSHLDCYRVAFCEFIPDIDHMGEYEVLREVYVNQNTGECTEIVFDYPDIPEVFLDVIFNREKFIYVDQDYLNGEYTYKTEETYLKTFKISGEWLFGKDPQDYSLLDIDGDSFPELIFQNVPRDIPGLILRYNDGKIYGYTWGGDGFMTDCTTSWHESAGEVQGLDLVYFDGLLLKSREIMRYDFSDPQNVKYYVEKKEVTKTEYDKFSALYNGEYLDYSTLDLYPVYVNPFPGG